jgi:hypothetical protein
MLRGLSTDREVYLSMKVPRSVSRVLVCQSAGFGLIALLSVYNHFFNLPNLLAGGGNEVSRWQDGVLETALILLIWAFAFSVTRRILLRLRYLEGMLRVCAWCRKIGREDKWMRLENYFAEGFDITTTHGICPDCLKKTEEDTKLFCRKECESRKFHPTEAPASGESLHAA